MRREYQHTVRFLALLLAAGLLALGAPGRAAAPSPAAPAAGASPDSKSAVSPTPTPPPTVPLAEIADEAQKAVAKLAAFAPAGGDETALATTAQTLQDAPELIRQLSASTSRETGPDSSLDNLRRLQTSWHQLTDSLKQRSAALAARAKTLDAASRQTQESDALWKATERATREAGAPAETVQLAASVLDAAAAAADRIQRAQTRVLEMQAEAGQLLSQAADGTAAVDEAIAQAVKGLLVRDSPPLWARRARLTASTVFRHPETLAEQAQKASAYAAGHADAFALHGVLFLLLLGAVLWLRRELHRWTEDEPGLKRAAPIFKAPGSAALALSFLLAAPLYEDAPDLFHALLRAVLLLPTVIILRRVVDERLSRELYALVGFFFIEQLRRALAAFPLLDRWIFCSEMVLAILICVRLGLPGGVELRSRIKRRYWLAAVILAAALAADAFGFTRLGVMLGAAVLRGAYLALVLYAAQRVLDGLIFIALRAPPLTASHIARQHREAVENQCSRLLSLTMALVWAVVMLNAFQLRGAFVTRALSVLDYRLHAGAVNLSLGQFLSFALAVWLSFVISRLVRFFLNEEVYERVTLAPGLPYAISTTLNYLILLVGFIVALALLGVDLTKVTIVAGAFSVGLGFGLQNVINNFVSGIILLFERPIKVGDVIQIGDAIGEVRLIGIRASIVSTHDGSDLIVPNGNLISNQVTNWTYSNRRGSLEVPVSVAGGADPQRVTALLKAAADSAMDHADAEVYVTAITAAATSLVVRVWINYTGDNARTRNVLLQALLAALAREKIALA